MVIYKDSNVYDRYDDNYIDYFYYNHEGVIAERHDDINQVKYFTRLGREMLAADDGGETYFYIQNLRGDVMLLVGADGVVKAIRDYDANGQMLGKTPRHGDRDPFGFTGGIDGGKGLWKLGARFYDSGKGSFIQQDRYMGDPRDPLSLNRYVYCGLDPVNFVDPTGFSSTGLNQNKLMKPILGSGSTGSSKNNNWTIVIGASGTLAWGGRTSILMGYGFDSQLNFGTVGSITVGGGSPSFGFSGFISWTNASSIYSLNGGGWNAGQSWSIPGAPAFGYDWVGGDGYSGGALSFGDTNPYVCDTHGETSFSFVQSFWDSLIMTTSSVGLTLFE